IGSQGGWSMKTYLIFLLSVVIVSCSSHSKDAVKDEPLKDKAALEYDLAFETYKRGDLIPALSAITRAIELNPNSADAFNMKGLILFRQGNHEESEIAFKKAGELNPKRTEIFVNLGALYYDMKRFPDSVTALE